MAFLDMLSRISTCPIFCFLAGHVMVQVSMMSSSSLLAIYLLLIDTLVVSWNHIIVYLVFLWFCEDASQTSRSLKLAESVALSYIWSVIYISMRSLSIYNFSIVQE